MFRIYKLTDDGFEMSLGYYPTIEDADEAIDHFRKDFPNAYIDVKEVD